MPPELIREMQGVFGEQLQVEPQDDIYVLAAKLLQDGRKQPSLLACCGAEDPFVHMNREFAQFMSTTAFNYRYVETPGTHDWRFWEQHLKTTFEFLFG
ncbi:hypothetical protein HMSSN139_13090 [Paenibacillus sp. HMSSN-139]|nr:hypothetical protein HMSSN139_13090 [Paenibacillus sp. HMSSN-139]